MSIILVSHFHSFFTPFVWKLAFLFLLTLCNLFHLHLFSCTHTSLNKLKIIIYSLKVSLLSLSLVKIQLKIQTTLSVYDFLCLDLTPTLFSCYSLVFLKLSSHSKSHLLRPVFDKITDLCILLFVTNDNRLDELFMMEVTSSLVKLFPLMEFVM